jgi:hypothetical protein
MKHSSFRITADRVAGLRRTLLAISALTTNTGAYNIVAYIAQKLVVFANRYESI